MRARFVPFVIAALSASPAAAEDWDWRITPYVWGTSIDGDIALGNVSRDVDVEFSEILDVLSGTALVHVEAEKGDHVLFGDLVWLAVEPEDEIATIGGVAEVSSAEVLAEYLLRLFPADEDSKLQALEEARALDPSSPFITLPKSFSDQLAALALHRGVEQGL